MNAKTGSMTSRLLVLLAVACLLLTAGAQSATTDAGAQVANTDLGAPTANTDFDAAIAHSQAVAFDVVSESETPGMSLAVAMRGEIIWAAGFGFADRERETPVTPRTRFGLGSVTKSLSMALCARLVQAGKLDWDAPIEEYLPDFPHAGQGITVRLIGAHLSGMGDEWAAGLRYTQAHFSTEEAYAEVVKQKLASEPGTIHLYATGTFTVIAAVVEAVTGMPLQEAMSYWVLEPLGMQDTVPNDPRVVIERCTIFYDPRDGVADEVIFDPSHKLAGAGYLSTAPDMARFASGLFEEEFLSAEFRAQLFTDMVTRDGSPTGFGLGWRITEEEGRPVYYQPGGGPGISSIVVLYPEQKLVFVALANHTRGPVSGRVMGETLEAFSSPGSPPR